MKRMRIIAFALSCFALGALSHAALAQTRAPVYNAAAIKDQPLSEAADKLLAGALGLAGNGSWERIAVGRAWYLGGQKAKGQEIFDSVTGSRKVEDSDWFRLGRVYAEAGEWDKAKSAFDKAMAMNPRDDSGMVEYGALANVYKDRVTAETLFEKAFKKKPTHFWHWVSAGGSYLGVRPPQ
jgi:tetratricopeptide (TPR) repeat protein